MPIGSPIDRHWVLMLHDGRAVIDWGNDLFQDVAEGTFIKDCEPLVSHHILDEELEILIRAGRVDRYDSKWVYFFSLPERPQKPIE